MCKTAKVSISGYYRWNIHGKDKQKRDKEAKELITKIFRAKQGKAGIRTIITKLRKKNPYNIAFKKGLEHRTAPNLLKQNFKVNQPDKVYSTDISYLFYNKGKRAYLSATKDLATKEIVAFNISKELDLNSTYGNFAEFLKSKNCSGLIIHSDQGWHYTHPYYVNKLKELGVTQSMSRKGNCLDNAPIESFFGHLKDEVDIKVENYIYYYNNERCQWSLNKMTPAQRRCHLLNSPA